MNALTPDQPFPDIPLLRKAVAWAEAEAAKTDGTGLWNQNLWAVWTECGTAYCIAGYTAMAALPGAETRPAACLASDYDLFVDGEWASWGDTAQRLLGLDDLERTALFDANNTIADVREVAGQIAARAGDAL